MDNFKLSRLDIVIIWLGNIGLIISGILFFVLMLWPCAENAYNFACFGAATTAIGFWKSYRNAEFKYNPRKFAQWTQ